MGLERKNRQNERADGQREAQGDYPQRDSGQHTRQRPTCRFVQQPNQAERRYVALHDSRKLTRPEVLFADERGSQPRRPR
jgi:hypothetical protein